MALGIPFVLNEEQLLWVHSLQCLEALLYWDIKPRLNYIFHLICDFLILIFVGLAFPGVVPGLCLAPCSRVNLVICGIQVFEPYLSDQK